jgi:hypothetical protein
MEAELVAASLCTQRIIHVRNLFLDFGKKLACTVYIDNAAPLKAIREGNLSIRAKHIDARYKFICQRGACDDIKYVDVASQDQVADFLTKMLPLKGFSNGRKGCGCTSE